MDPLAIPVLMHAIDFLFEEAGKILDERRERRRTAGNEAEDYLVKDEQTPSAKAINSRSDALEAPIDLTVWQDSQSRVEHLLSLLDIYTKNYYSAKKSFAIYGAADVPPIILHRLIDAEDGIAQTTKELQKLLRQVYGKELQIPGAQ